MQHGNSVAPRELRKLVANDYCQLDYDAATRVVRFVRSDVTIRSAEEARRFFGEAVAAITTLGRHRIRLVLDMRQAPMRNDPQYEQVLAEFRREVSRDVARVAVIVRTAVGRLHAQRLGKADSIEQAIVGSEAEALAYVTSA
jgi:hypothetical protein